MSKTKCPKFLCDGVGIPAVTDKKFSAKKAIVGNAVGGLLFGPVGAIAGACTGVNGKNGKTTMVCNKCGNTWTTKL